MAVQLRKVECRWCDQVFFTCQWCDFGRWYCSDSCSYNAWRCSRRRARRKYAGSKNGRLNNRERQRRHRRRKTTAGKNKVKQDSVTDQSSQISLPGISCSHGETPDRFNPVEQPLVASATQSAPARPTLSQPRYATSESQATKEAAKEESQESGKPVREAQCSFCGRWGVVVEATSTRGRFRRRPHGRYMNPRRRE